MTAYPGCAGLARSPFVLTEHISSYLTNELLKLPFRRPPSVGLVKIVLFARVSSNKYGVGDILEREASGALRWSGTIKSKTEGSWEETWPDHAIRRSVAITILPLG